MDDRQVKRLSVEKRAPQFQIMTATGPENRRWL